MLIIITRAEKDGSFADDKLATYDYTTVTAALRLKAVPFARNRPLRLQFAGQERYYDCHGNLSSLKALKRRHEPQALPLVEVL